MKTLVRCADRMVFEIDPNTLEALTCSYYDAYCFTDPLTEANYVNYFEWLNRREKRWKNHFGVE